MTVKTNELDKHIELQHNSMTAYWTSGQTMVSDLYVFKQYKAALARIAELEAQLPDPADFDDDEASMFLMGTGCI